MSVYTIVERDQLEDFLSHYDLGKLLTYQGISAGIENTNYFVTTSTGEFVLTLFEYLKAEELRYFLELMTYFSERQVPCAHPVKDKTGQYLRILNEKPAALVEKLRGKDVKNPTINQCYALGESLGHLHLISPKFQGYRANQRSYQWWHTTFQRVLPFLEHEDANLLKNELIFQSQYKNLDLPKGVIHADLFRDNALFEGEILRGIIDFYYACNDILLYDVAVVINDWCSQADGELDGDRLHSLLEGYVQKRPFTQQEKQAWHIMLRAAALRFWLSRLQDLHFPRPGEITHIKDPTVFQRILRARIMTVPIQILI
jgi:homoserine kinase type II